jgi:hypothetical protein
MLAHLSTPHFYFKENFVVLACSPRQIRCKPVTGFWKAWRLYESVVNGVSQVGVPEAISHVCWARMSARQYLAVSSYGFCFANDRNRLQKTVKET